MRRLRRAPPLQGFPEARRAAETGENQNASDGADGADEYRPDPQRIFARFGRAGRAGEPGRNRTGGERELAGRQSPLLDPPLVRTDEMPPAPLVPLSGAFCGHGAAGRRGGLAGPFGAALQARP